MARIIVVEDDLAQQEEILSFLTHSGHDVRAAADSQQLYLVLRDFTPDIALLDYNLPGEAGPVLAERLRERYALDIGIVMITARSLTADRIEARRAGADSYLVKPIDFGEMLAVIDNLLPRIHPPGAARPAWKLDLAGAQLLPPDAAPVHLVGAELSLLSALASENPHKASREKLIRAMGKNPSLYDPRALEACISRLRRKLPMLEDGRNPLQALRGSGYQFLCPIQIAQ